MKLFCKLESMLGSDRNRFAIVFSVLLPIILGMSREVPLNLVADVFLSGDEAMVRGDECGCGISATGSATI